MLDRLEALHALAEARTMGRAAAALRVTQSAVSKRIAALEAELGTRLIEREGRRVRLTAEALRLLAEARPLLLQLREALRPRDDRREQPLRVAATDSLLASWLPGALRAALDALPGVELELHAHRGPVLLERVRAGDYALGLCPAGAGDGELVVRELMQESMVIVPSRLLPLAPGAIGGIAPALRGGATPVVPVWAIEKRSLTWEAIESRLARVRRRAGFAIEVHGRLESFTALVQVARAGFANALVPIGVARELGVPRDRVLAVPGLARPIAAVGRRSTFERPAVRALLGALSGVLEQPASAQLS
jgi:DNA-binding transcriptional LysR family regulator